MRSKGPCMMLTCRDMMPMYLHIMPTYLDTMPTHLNMMPIQLHMFYTHLDTMPTHPDVIPTSLVMILLVCTTCLAIYVAYPLCRWFSSLLQQPRQ